MRTKKQKKKKVNDIHSKNFFSLAQWLVPVISATWEAKMGIVSLKPAQEPQQDTVSEQKNTS
jgi:hypothetical protein